MKTNIEKCDPIILKAIAEDWLEDINKPMEVQEARPFTILDEDSGNETTYRLNVANPAVRREMARMKTIHRHLGEKSENFDLVYSYDVRIRFAGMFVYQNEDQLIRTELVKNEETHQLVANVIYYAAATCKVGKRGFKFDDMMKEIKKYEQ